jgi:hypothetical protein
MDEKSREDWEVSLAFLQDHRKIAAIGAHAGDNWAPSYHGEVRAVGGPVQHGSSALKGTVSADPSGSGRITVNGRPGVTTRARLPGCGNTCVDGPAGGAMR